MNGRPTSRCIGVSHALSHDPSFCRDSIPIGRIPALVAMRERLEMAGRVCERGQKCWCGATRGAASGVHQSRQRGVGRRPRGGVRSSRNARPCGLEPLLVFRSNGRVIASWDVPPTRGRGQSVGRPGLNVGAPALPIAAGRLEHAERRTLTTVRQDDCSGHGRRGEWRPDATSCLRRRRTAPDLMGESSRRLLG